VHVSGLGLDLEGPWPWPGQLSPWPRSMCSWLQHWVLIFISVALS